MARGEERGERKYSVRVRQSDSLAGEEGEGGKVRLSEEKPRWSDAAQARVRRSEQGRPGTQRNALHIDRTLERMKCKKLG